MIDTAKDPLPWKCILYFVFISTPFSLFAFAWIWGTFFAAVSTSFIPFMASFFWWLWTLSWRSLGAIEILSIQLCHGADLETLQIPNIFGGISELNELKMFFPQILYDKYTWRCFTYFVLIKWFVTLFTCAYAIVLMAFWFLPPCLPLSEKFYFNSGKNDSTGEYFRDSSKEIIENIKSLVKKCHEKDIPVFWTQHGHRNIEFDGGSLARWWGKDKSIKWGSKDWEILPELQSHVLRSPTSANVLDFTITSKTRYDAFYKTELNSLLTSLGIETLIISGVLTNLCCETTARSGFNQDYNIIFLDDATAAESEEMHKASVLNLRYGFADIYAVKDISKWL
ncbi:8134_t:CDS:2 [Cetraspora pellucida]|uniref:8134_t:CDS:1 n=1 Tax=Cetraspora pellucida TaxID=1433469 RepID=A0A9N9D804_9GLOM|nr:8134_t:CDS:2 [Cetraspora pellucida]